MTFLDSEHEHPRICQNHDESQIFQRRDVEFKDFARFNLTSEHFDGQLSHDYTTRLAALKDILIERVKNKWGQHRILQLVDLAEKENEKEQYILIGILYKHQELKPSILRELSEELQLISQPFRSNYYFNKDCVFLEDETMRVKLIGNQLDVEYILPGVICAVLGHVTEDGSFWVEDWCFPGNYLETSILNSPSKNGARLLLISGLDMVNNAESLAMSLLSEWISGMIGNSITQKAEASIVHVVIAGNSVRGTAKMYVKKDCPRGKVQDTSVTTETIMAVQRLDTFLSQIVKCCRVTLMPGQFDPTTCHVMPQQPLHPCALPKSSRFKSLHGATNPWIGSLGSRILAGSSGQPINDIMKIAGTAEVSPLVWLERTLYWRHFAPTVPDILSAHPYSENDPFIMQEFPDIYFVGNMERYETKLLAGKDGQMVRLVCIPQFSKTQMAVLVDLQSLDTWPISYGTN